jgi:hypothetical protein
MPLAIGGLPAITPTEFVAQSNKINEFAEIVLFMD